MSVSNYDLLYIITNIFDTYIVYKFLTAFFEREGINKRIEIISYVLYFLCITSVYFFLNIPIITLICNVIVLFLLSFNYGDSMKKRIFAVAFIYIILISIESIVGLLSGYVEISVLNRNEKYSSVAGMIIIKIFTYIAALFINNYKNVKNEVIMPNIYWIAMFFIPTISLFVILSVIEMSDINSYNIVLITSGLLLVNFFVFYLYDKLSEKQEEKYEKIMLLQQNNFYQRQFKSMELSLKTMKSFRHDIKNHLYVLNSLVGTGEIEGALRHITQMTGALTIKEEYACSGNVIIDSILNFKLQEAEKKGIKVDLELSIPEKLNITSFDMSVIFGNLLDNAINAAIKSTDEKSLDIAIKYRIGRLVAKISNTYNGELNCRGDELITTNEDKENHGIGIKNIKSTLNKYNGEMEIEHEGNVFTVLLLMYPGNQLK